MDKLLSKMEEPLMKFSMVLARNKVLQSIKDAFIFSLPFTVVGSFAGLIKSQLEYFGNELGVLANPFFKGVVDVLNYVGSTSMGLIGIVIVLCSAYFYARHLSEKSKNTNPLTVALAAMIMYFITVPSNIMVEGLENPVAGYALNFLNFEGMFVGLIVGLLTSYLYSILIEKGITIKLPDSVPSGILNSFKALIPIAIIAVLFATARCVVEALGYDSIQVMIRSILIVPLESVGTGLPAIIIVILFMQLFWFFGLHGFSIVWGVVSVIWVPIFLGQIDAYTATQSIEGITQVAPNTITNIYAMIGGSGSTLGLIIALFILAPKKSAEREVAKIGVIPGIFNINEPIIFGLPIVLNPMMFIPFVFIPIVNALVAYFAVNSGIVAPMVALNSGVEPVFFNAWVLGGFNLTPAILMAVLLVIDVFLYMPFVKMLLKAKKIEETES